MTERERVIWVINAACPSRCAYCDIESQRAKSALSTNQVRKTATDIVDAGFHEVIFVGGEPLLSPQLPAALEVLRGRAEIAAFTGGIPLAPARSVDIVRRGIDRLVFSIDSGHDETNDLIRGRAGITRELLRFADAVRASLPDIDISINTVVSRRNAASVEDVWQRMRTYRPTSMALTLAGDNFDGSPTEHMLLREQIVELYLSVIPRLAARMDADRAELVVLPVPMPFLMAGIPAREWRTAAERLRGELDIEFDRYSSGDYNRAFVERCGCPLVGTDVSIGIEGEVYPCSQAPALRREYVVGDVTSTSLDNVLHGAALARFRANVPHLPCTRCWAPSNVQRDTLLRVLRSSQ